MAARHATQTAHAPSAALIYTIAAIAPLVAPSIAAVRASPAPLSALCLTRLQTIQPQMATNASRETANSANPP